MNNSKKNYTILMLVTVFLLILNTISFADNRTDSQREIEHLLHFVARTSCQYERNGSLYNGAEAKAHISKKYDYYKDKIISAEDFIAWSATKSMMSGKKYKIHCPDSAAIYSADWLQNELEAYRKRHHQ